MKQALAEEVARLENLWGGVFGNEYAQRNRKAHEGRLPFWEDLLQKHSIHSVLEVGCNIGANLRWISRLLPHNLVCGIDINQNALRELHSTYPNVNALQSTAQCLPFQNEQFDLVFTCGVLIHQPPSAIQTVTSEIVRCSRRYILCAEYYSNELVEIPYREQRGALFKQDYGMCYQESHPGLILAEEGFLSRKDGGWDDLTYWLFSKQRGDDE